MKNERFSGKNSQTRLEEPEGPFKPAGQTVAKSKKDRGKE
jgi:hypothetical protein